MASPDARAGAGVQMSAHTDGGKGLGRDQMGPHGWGCSATWCVRARVFELARENVRARLYW